MILGLVAFYVAARINAHAALIIGWAVPALGGLIAAYLAPKSRFNVGASTCIAAIAILGLGSYIAGQLGYGDAIGIEGHLLIMVLYALPVAFSSVVGALVGELIARKRANG
jgi:hypothetical protein